MTHSTFRQMAQPFWWNPFHPYIISSKSMLINPSYNCHRKPTNKSASCSMHSPLNVCAASNASLQPNIFFKFRLYSVAIRAWHIRIPTPKIVPSVDSKLYTIYELDWNFAINKGSEMMKLFVYFFPRACCIIMGRQNRKFTGDLRL